jgi:afadin
MPQSRRPTKEAERNKLKKVIAEWNASRLDMFAMSDPSEDLEFHGVMRFFFQDTSHRVATKCVRVSSTATTQQVVKALVERFRPDMKMLTATAFSLFEVFSNGG